MTDRQFRIVVESKPGTGGGATMLRNYNVSSLDEAMRVRNEHMRQPLTRRVQVFVLICDSSTRHHERETHERPSR